MKHKFTDGWELMELQVSKTMSDDTTLTADEKVPFISFTCSAASKALTLDLDHEGDTMLVSNIGGTNAVTVKAIKGDSGTSVGAGKVALVIASLTANASKIYLLN